jgi:hypothetical protein
MYILRSRVVRLGAVLLLAVAVMAAAYGFAATNTVPDSKAGDGTGTIGGYTVSNVTYTLMGSDPQKIASVSLTLNANASTVKITLDGSTWLNCNGGPTNWSCSTGASGFPVVSATQLRVVAVQ